MVPQEFCDPVRINADHRASPAAAPTAATATTILSKTHPEKT